MADINNICLYCQQGYERRADFDVGVIEEFGMTDCSQHFGEDLAGVDRVIWVVHFNYTLTSILLAFGSVKSLGLTLAVNEYLNGHTSRAIS